MMYAVCGLITVLGFGAVAASGQITFPLESVTWRIIVRGISLPPLAIAPYALIMSIGWTSIVPMPIDLTGTDLGTQWIPKSWARL